MFDKASPYAGKVTAYDAPIYIADAALYLMTTQPDLGINDPYSLNQKQFDAAVALLKEQQTIIGEYWNDYTKTQQAFEQGSTVLGTTWQVIVNLADGQRRHGRDGAAEGGRDRLVRHLDGLVEGRPPELHVPVDGLHHLPRGAGPGGVLLRRGPGQPEGVRPIDRTTPTHCDVFKATDEAFCESIVVLGHAAQGVPRRRAATACRSPTGSRPGRRSRADPSSAGRGDVRAQPTRSMTDDSHSKPSAPGGRRRAGCTVIRGLRLVVAARRAGGVAAGALHRLAGRRCSSPRCTASNEDGSGIEKVISLAELPDADRQARLPRHRRSHRRRSRSLVTVIDIVLALPIAFFIAKVVRARWRRPARRRRARAAVGRYLVKAFAWRAILGTPGGVLDKTFGAQPRLRRGRRSSSCSPTCGCRT